LAIVVIKVYSDDRYDYYVGDGDEDRGGRPVIYNIKPAASPKPSSGYYNLEYLEESKGVKFPPRSKWRQS